MDKKIFEGENLFFIKKFKYMQFSGDCRAMNSIQLKETIKAECALKKGSIVSVAFVHNEIEIVAAEEACPIIVAYLKKYNLNLEKGAFDNDDEISTARFAREVAKRHTFLGHSTVVSIQRFWTILKQIGAGEKI